MLALNPVFERLSFKPGKILNDWRNRKPMFFLWFNCLLIHWQYLFSRHRAGDAVPPGIVQFGERGGEFAAGGFHRQLVAADFAPLIRHDYFFGGSSRMKAQDTSAVCPLS